MVALTVKSDSLIKPSNQNAGAESFEMTSLPPTSRAPAGCTLSFCHKKHYQSVLPQDESSFVFCRCLAASGTFSGCRLFSQASCHSVVSDTAGNPFEMDHDARRTGPRGESPSVDGVPRVTRIFLTISRSSRSTPAARIPMKSPRPLPSACP